MFDKTPYGTHLVRYVWNANSDQFDERYKEVMKVALPEERALLKRFTLAQSYRMEPDTLQRTFGITKALDLHEQVGKATLRVAGK